MLPYRSVLALALGCAGLMPLSPAFAHAVCGDRIFPATLAIDDPGVNDELALPTLSWVPNNGDGSQEFDASFSWQDNHAQTRDFRQRRPDVAASRRLWLGGAGH
jgi:hypothetical protein